MLFLEVNQTLYLGVKPNESLQGVYYLGRSLEGLVVKEGTAQAVVTEGRRIQCDQVNLHVTGVMLFFMKKIAGGVACLSCPCRASPGR